MIFYSIQREKKRWEYYSVNRVIENDFAKQQHAQRQKFNVNINYMLAVSRIFFGSVDDICVHLCAYTNTFCVEQKFYFFLFFLSFSFVRFVESRTMNNCDEIMDKKKTLLLRFRRTFGFRFLLIWAIKVFTFPLHHFVVYFDTNTIHLCPVERDPSQVIRIADAYTYTHIRMRLADTIRWKFHHFFSPFVNNAKTMNANEKERQKD